MTLTPSTRVDVLGWQPAHLSYSTVDGYRTCGMRTKLQKVLRKEQLPGLAGIGGNAVHAATEYFDLDPNADKVDVATVFAKCWDDEIEKRKKDSPSYSTNDYIATGRAKAEYGGKRGFRWWLDHGPGMVQAWIDWREKSGWSIWETPEGNPAVELQLNIVLPGDIPVLMYIDRIMVTPAGQIVVLDIKTGRLPETPEQLGLYALGLEQTWGEMFRPDWGYFWSPEKGHSTPQPLGMYTADYFASMYSEAVAGINAGCFLAKPANNCRSWCGVAKFCPAVGGSIDAS